MSTPAELKPKRCEYCGVEHLTYELSRFGRHKGSPYVCKVCADYMLSEMKRKLKGPKRWGLIE